jgi:5'-3' exonuclease
MALKIRDDGIPKLMEIYGKVALPLVDPTSWTYHHDALCELYNRIGGEEPSLVLKAVKHKLEARVGSTASKDAAEQAISRYNDTPVLWAAESILVNKTDKAIASLKPDWETNYDKAVYSLADPEKVVTLYLQAVAWTLKYYAGEPIDTWFYYPWFLPPRSTVIHTWLKSNRITPPTTSRPPLHPQHQLAMVLPADSFHLLPPQYATLPRAHPYAWPTDWAVYSFGRRFMWECEPLIPLIEPRHMIAWTSGL